MDINRRGKIVATMGPSTTNKEILRNLFKEGVNIARLNFSHGSHEDHAKMIKNIREIAKELSIPIAIMQDLQGPKIRTGELGNGINLVEGETVILTTDEENAKEHEIPVDFPNLPSLVFPGKLILMDDGNLELKVIETKGNQVFAKVVLGGLLKSHKGINLPGTPLTISGFTEKDKRDLVFGISHNVDAVAISFVRTPDDIEVVRNAILELAPDKKSVPIIAKLERPEALDNLAEIIDISDGVMVARGDLGVELPPEMVPIVQKQIINMANKKGKIVITATQMLDSMINNPRPTRAEASDVANAIFDGTDAVMLSGETAAGKHPLEAVKIMNKIIIQSELNLKTYGHWKGTESESVGDDATSITRAARELAHDLNVAAIVVFTQSGRTAGIMSKALPRVPILGFTPEPVTYRKMAFYWGVYSYMIPYADTLEEMLNHVDNAMVKSTPIKPGQQVVIISGFPVGARRLPNLALLYTVGQTKH
jgi:pyruvate kinase